MVKELGKFEVTSGHIRVTDPIYPPDIWCAGDFEAKNGIWDAYIVMSDNHPDRVAELVIRHESIPHAPDYRFVPHAAFIVGCDSANVGFFDLEEYRKLSNQEWFGDHVTSACDNKTLKWGCVSTAGWGDGQYKCWVILHEGSIVAAKVVFIDDEEEEEDIFEDEDEDEEDEDEDFEN
jgi:hypothetical protein